MERQIEFVIHWVKRIPQWEETSSSMDEDTIACNGFLALFRAEKSRPVVKARRSSTYVDITVFAEFLLLLLLKEPRLLSHQSGAK